MTRIVHQSPVVTKASSKVASNAYNRKLKIPTHFSLKHHPVIKKQQKANVTFDTGEVTEGKAQNPRTSKAKNPMDNVKASLSIIDKNLNYLQHILPKRNGRQEGELRLSPQRQNLRNLKAGTLTTGGTDLGQRPK
jgi:hypothetical protein